MLATLTPEVQMAKPGAAPKSVKTKGECKMHSDLVFICLLKCFLNSNLPLSWEETNYCGIKIFLNLKNVSLGFLFRLVTMGNAHSEHFGL